MQQEPLFAPLDEEKRKKLHARGWRQVGGQTGGRMFWKNPEHGALMQEDEAFRWLARQEAEEAEEARPS